MGQPIALGSVVFRVGGAPRLAVIAKVTFDISHQGAVVSEPIGLHDDVHHEGNEGRSLLFASDRVPRKGGRCDVLFVGAAYAPVGQRVTRLATRLRLAEGNQTLVDKRLDVRAEQSFQTLPIRWELAENTGDNPYGQAVPPQVVPSDPESGAVPGLGPIASRGRVVGAATDVGADFDFGVYEVAPVDQRIRALTGHEEVLLVGLHPALPEVRSRFPGVLVQATITIDGVDTEVPLVGDTLVVFGDTLTATFTLRGDVAIDEATFADPSRAAIQARFVEVARKVAPRAKAFASTQVTVGAALPLKPSPASPASPAPPVEGDRPTMVLDTDVSAFAKVPESSVPRRPKNPLAATQEAVSPVIAFEKTKTAGGTAAPEPRKKAFSGTLEAGTSSPFASWPALDPEQRFVLPPEPTQDIPVARPALEAPRFEAPEIEIVGEDEVPFDEPVRSSLPPSVIASEPPAESRVDVATLPPLRPPARTTEDLPILDLGPWSACSFPFQLDPPKDARIVVVKVTAQLVPGGRAKLAEPLPPNGDVHWDDDPEASLRYSTDFAPFKPKADVLLVGHARDASGKGVSLVQFRLGKALSRRLAVFGDRTWERGVGSPTPFDRVPLRWERALGGPLSEQNPLGMGFKTGVRIPNLEDSDVRIRTTHDPAPPACTAPLSPGFQVRSGKLGTYGRKWLDTRWPYFPEDFDWAFFNAAPAEQQLDYLGGDETYLLAGVGARDLTEGQLPGVRPRAFALRTEANGSGLFEVILRLDTVWFDADADQVVLVYRGFFETVDDEATDVSSLFVMPDEPGLDLDGARARMHRELFTRGLLAAKVETEEAPPENQNAGAGASLGDLYRQMAAQVEATQKAKRVPAAAAPPSSKSVATPRPAPTLTSAELAALLAAARQGGTLEGRDLSWVRLDGADLRGLDLHGVVLHGARLRNARLDGARLDGAVLSQIEAEGASFAKASLVFADLTGATLDDADFTEAILDDAVLDGIHAPRLRLDGAHGERVKLVGARLIGAGGEKVRLPECDLTAAVLEAVRLVGADLRAARLYDAEGMDVCLDDALLDNLRADGAHLRRARFIRAKGEGAIFAGAELDLAVLESATMPGADFAGAQLEEAVFDRADLVGARFRRSTLRRALLRKANLMGASFEKAELSGADLRGANLYGTDTYRARTHGVRLELALVANSRFAARR